MELLICCLLMTGVMFALVGRADRRPAERPPLSVEDEDPALEAKLASIEQGESRGADALVRICLSRSTPDPQRARALEMLAARVDAAAIAPILDSMSRACGRETCAEIFRQASSFPDPPKLETAALAVLRSSRDLDLCLAALFALEAVGTPRSFSLLDRLVARSELNIVAVQARASIASRHPAAGELRGALSAPEAGALSLPGDS